MGEAPPAAEHLIGRHLGDFIVRERLGEGGFGAVYLADQPLLGRRAVIKVLHTAHRDSETTSKRFLAEAQLASRLDHPYAAHVYAFGAEVDGTLWIAMELVRGTTLDALLAAQGRVAPERFAPLFQRICEVVHAAHELGIVHRDLKLANVMVMSRGGHLLPKLLDFGIAKDLGTAAADGVPTAMPVDDDATVDVPSGGDTPTVHARGASAATPASRSPQPLGSQAFTPTPSSDGGRGSVSSLTRAGSLLGSPPYMAPEQWKATAVGPRTDLYALGVVAYRMLTGRHPFTGKTVVELGRAHLTQAVPPLGHDLPLALDQVIARAMAKRPEDRHGSALELAAEFVAASGLTSVTEVLPALEAPVRDSFLTDAPQPLAEAVALLDAAKSVERVLAAVDQIARITARYLAVLAIACRTKIGAGAGDDTTAQALLARLRSNGLCDAEWVRLARELSRPFAATPDSHPLPELVALFFDADGEDRDDPFRGVLATAEEARARDATERVRALSALLRQLSFVSTYRLVVPHAGIAQRWMGLRRPRRAGDAAPGLTAEHAVLLDGDGGPVVSLWPLLQVAAPVPGGERELFFLEGPGRHSARLVALPQEYVQHDDELWSWFASEGLCDDAGALPAELQERAPYLGLSAFTAEDAGCFYGRERETAVAVNRLKREPFLAVVGPSGAGKSSFVSAGVIPTWTAGEAGARTIYVRPGPAPLRALAVRLAREGVGDEQLAARLRKTPDALADALGGLCADGRTVFLLIDQFEELFTLGADAGERAAYCEAIAAALGAGIAPLRILITLRDDFLIRLQEQPSLRDALAAGLQLLSTPVPADLLRILVEPARRLGFVFEDAALPEEMVADVASEPSALPLLSFTAERLWEQRDRHFKQLTRRTYVALGGVGGALARHAEELLGKLDAHEARLVREAFRHLVTADGTRAVLSRAELAELLGGGARAERVIEQLIGARLAVAQEGERGSERIEIAHEALVQAWPRLLRWRQEDAEGARLRDQLRAAARQWSERGQPGGLLWRDEALSELQFWRKRHGLALTSAEAAFADASLREGTRARRLRRRLIAAVLALSIGAAAGMAGLAERARRSAATARARVLELYVEEGRRLVLVDDPVRALAYLREAWEGGLRSTDNAALIGTALAQLAPLEHSYGPHQGRVLWATASPDKRAIWTGGEDGTLKQWDAASGALLRTIEGPGGGVLPFDFDAEGHLVAGGMRGQIGIWDPATGARLRTLDAHALGGRTVRISPDRRRVVQTTTDSVLVWRTGDGMQLVRLPFADAPLRSAYFTPDGERLIVTLETGELQVWSAASPARRLAVLAVHRGPVVRVSFSTDGTRAVTCSEDGTAKILSVAGPTIERTLSGHSQAVYDAKFSPDGKRVLTVSADRTARIWDAATGALEIVLEGHRGGVLDGQFSQDGTRVITSGSDGTARVWDVDGRPIVALIGHRGPVAVAAFDGAHALTAGSDGAARTWTIERGLRERVLRGHTGEVRSIASSSDGTSLVTESRDGTVRVWDATAGAARHIVELGTGPLGGGWFSHDLQTLAWAGESTEVSIGALATRTARCLLRGHRGNVESLAFSPDDASIVTGAQGHELFGWDARSCARIWSQTIASDTAVSVGYTPDGRLVATAGSDGVAELRDAHSGALVQTLRGHQSVGTSVAFSGDGRRLVTTSVDKTAKIWDVHTGALLGSLDDNADQVWSAAFLSDGTRVATAALDGTIRLWDTTSFHQVGELRGNAGAVLVVQMSADRRHLLSGSADATGLVWRLPDLFRGDLALIDRAVTGLDRYRLDLGRATRIP